MGPVCGARCNPDKVVLDPYALAVANDPTQHPSLFAHAAGSFARDTHDNAPYAPKGVVIDESFDWQDDRRPRTPWSRTVLYEAHGRGAAREPESPVDLMGSFSLSGGARV